jgi:hypothetical protein
MGEDENIINEKLIGWNVSSVKWTVCDFCAFSENFPDCMCHKEA